MTNALGYGFSTDGSSLWPRDKEVDWNFGLSVEVNDTNWVERFDEFKDTPVFFLIFAPWCGFSRRAVHEWATISNAVNAPDSKYHFIAAHFNVNFNSEVYELLRIKKGDSSIQASTNPYPQYKVMHAGQLYPFTVRGAREAAIVRFGEEAWKSAPSIPIERSLMDLLLDLLESAQYLFLNRTRGAVTLLFAGVLGGLPCGLLLGYMLFGCASSRSKNPVSNGKKTK